MNKLLSVILASMMLLSVTACGKPASPAVSSDKDTPASTSLPSGDRFLTGVDLKDKVVGMCDNPIPKEKILADYDSDPDMKPKEIIFVPGVGELLMLVKNGQVEAGLLNLASTADYIVSKNPELSSKVSEKEQTISMVLKRDDSELVTEINGAIAEIKKSGIGDELKKNWIDNFDESNVVTKKVANIEGAETIKVGISGYEYPLDYVNANGEPAGYNVEMMTEISRLISKNVEFVVIPNDSVFTSLASEKIDVFFWQVDSDHIPESLVRTDSYYSSPRAYLFKAK